MSICQNSSSHRPSRLSHSPPSLSIFHLHIRPFQTTRAYPPRAYWPPSYTIHTRHLATTALLLRHTQEDSYLPIICAGVYEDGDSTIEEVGDVVLSRGRVFVHVEVEEGTDSGGATGEIVRGGDAEEGAHRGLVEIILNDGVFCVTKIADAWLTDGVNPPNSSTV